MTADSWPGVPELLSRLEDRELPLLSWGVVDGFLSRADVDEAIEAQLDSDAANLDIDFHTADEYLAYLLDHGLLHRIPDGPERYRTRIAEALRLLKSLRQLWPRDTSEPGWWRASSALVADYRLRVAPRRYPRRDISVSEAISALKAVAGWSAEGTRVLERILDDGRLARFQVDAAASVLEALGSAQLAARIVTAGTGSGKTLAFYLPAIADIAATAGVARRGPHTLALYPRIELLRDQAREAVRMAQVVGDLNGPGSRPLRVGLLYGSTPSTRDFEASMSRPGWRRLDRGWASPFFPCLNDGCPGDMVWLDADRVANNEQLTCNSCGLVTPRGVLVITREAIERNPPDILFSSTEMLSKQSTNPRLRAILGWDGPTGTRMVLLDEAHTYTGLHGAQVALMLRRWRHANRQWGAESPVMVGLSATLRDAGDFFATLTGVDRSNVEVIAPAPEDLDAISREYGIVLRGDPVSGSPLLSTSIQTIMLLERVMDLSPGIYGSTTFAFTDDLDSINRLHDNLRDAEGHSPRGRARGEVLAELRSPALPEAAARYRDGQSWDLPAQLRRLDGGLRVARTSSQDAGVDSGADVVVATSSLEVGFNDPRVGAVVQHKAPRDFASFLQRRGRAGRRLTMRPVTAVVLSDYGRDRVAYQTYEKLLDPEIDAKRLPIGNRFVVKIQATHALVDWIARRTGTDARALLAPPSGRRQSGVDKVTGLLARLVEDGELQQDLGEHVGRALKLGEAESQAALWEEPRSLMLSVVPTVLRRLQSNWTPLAGEADAGAIPWTPLPEFMTATLFGALNTPDVILELPENFRDSETTMPIAQALREAVPGRVSRRFGYGHATHSTWLPVPEADKESLPLVDVVSRGHALGSWNDATGETRMVVRPLALRLVAPPSDLADTSNALPLWRSVFEIPETALHRVELPSPSIWEEYFTECAFALHAGGAPLKVRRMAIGSDGELRKRDGSSTPVHVRYEHDGSPAALGFELEVDAMIVKGSLPSDPRAYLGEFPESPAGRTMLFRRQVLEDARLDDLANVFQRQWLTEAYLHAFVRVGLGTQDRASIPEALANGRWADDMHEFLAAAYRSEDAGEHSDSRTLKTLSQLAADSRVRSVIEEHGRVLVAPDLVVTSRNLLDRVFLDTVANAVLTATEDALVDAQEGDLTVDLEVSSQDRTFMIVVSETSIGGLGLIEGLHREYSQDPRHFWESVVRASFATDAEDVDASLQGLMPALAASDTPIAEHVAAFRKAKGIAAMDAALEGLLAAWEEVDGPPSHLLVSTLASRTLRPGSSPAVDRIVADLAQAWIREEDRLGIEIDARTLIYHASRGDLGVALDPLTPDAAYSLLWLRGPQARGQRLEHWHPYRRDVVVERRILEHAFVRLVPEIDVTRVAWVDEYTTLMSRDGRALLTTPYASRRTLAEALRVATVTAIEHGGLRVYGRLVGVRQRQGSMFAEIALAEELQ